MCFHSVCLVMISFYSFPSFITLMHSFKIIKTDMDTKGFSAGASSSIYTNVDITDNDQQMHSVLNPAEFLKMKPKKSILKAKQTSIDDLHRAVEEMRDYRDNSEEIQKAHFDEMNILATHHPPDKDYGHMKIDEPKTPFYNYSDSEGEELSGGSSRPRRVSLVGAVDADELRKNMSEGTRGQIKVLDPPGSGEDDEDSESGMTEEQITKKREFEKKRKTHYNEGAFLKKMRERATKEEEEDEQQ